MGFVVADTSPLNYLILIEQIDLLPKLFDERAVPIAVARELSSSRSPASVRRWITNPPPWLIVEDPEAAGTPDIPRKLDPGEASAIRLAIARGADLLVMDDRKGTDAARQLGFRITGTLGILDIAASRGWVDFSEVALRLESTNFRRPRTLLEMLRTKHGSRPG